MIAFVEGILAEKQPTRVVVDVHGVGYEAHIPLSSYDRLPREGEAVRLLTVLVVREDGQWLYGFMTEAERQLFTLLNTVSGIGPKTALSALSGLPVRELKAAIVAGDLKRLSSISGIGKKTAERIALELRDRIGDAEALEAIAGSEPAPHDLKLRDVALALVSLGYKQAEAQAMLRRIPAEEAGAASVEDLVRRALSSR